MWGSPYQRRFLASSHQTTVGYVTCMLAMRQETRTPFCGYTETSIYLSRIVIFPKPAFNCCGPRTNPILFSSLPFYRSAVSIIIIIISVRPMKTMKRAPTVAYLSRHALKVMLTGPLCSTLHTPCAVNT